MSHPGHADIVRFELRLPRALADRVIRWQRGLMVPTTRQSAINVLLDVGLSQVEADSAPGDGDGG